MACLAIFVGIPVTYQSLIAGIQSQSRLRPAIKTFREINGQRRWSAKNIWLPEELICHIETYLKAEAHLHGLSELQNQEKSDRTDIYTISEFLESTANDFLQLNYSLSAKVTQDTPAGFGFQFKKVYICIPWKSVLLEDDTEKEAWIPSADLGFYDSLYKGPANDESKTSWTSDTTVIEQDLSVTVEKTLALNKAIREINLVVPSKFKRSDFNWQTASDGPEGGIGDEEWPSVYSEEHGKLWTPRVLAVCQTKLEL